MSSHDPECAICGKEVSSWELGDAMHCPHAYDYVDVIEKMMPKFPSQKEFEKFQEICKQGGWDIDSWRGNKGSEEVVPIVPQLRNALERLMRYEPIDGARFHASPYVCLQCVTAAQKCNSCGAEHAPKCNICGCLLEPLSQE